MFLKRKRKKLIKKKKKLCIVRIFVLYKIYKYI